MTQIALLVNGQIIIDHTSVDQYNKIPAEYITKIKKMRGAIPGLSHASGYLKGLNDLESLNATYQVRAQFTAVAPYANDNAALRWGKNVWDANIKGWTAGYDVEEWCTNVLSYDPIANTKAGITYTLNGGWDLDAMGFGWCWDTEIDIDDYIYATQQYVNFVLAQGYDTKIFFTTGNVAPYKTVGTSGEYNQYLKYEKIREYVKADPDLILFDYADILCWDDAGNHKTVVYNGKTYPWIAEANAANEGDSDYYAHISTTGCLRIGKALWVMMARIAGWDGGTSSISIPVTGITVTGTGGATTVTSGGTLQLVASVSPSTATNKSVAWSITNGTGQATINSSGLLSAISGGTVTAKATAKDGSGVFGTLTINISSQVTPGIPVYSGSSVENVTPSRLDITFSLGLTSLTIPSSAFTVTINSAVRAVNSISIDGTKVFLTLAGPVYSGDIITVAYTKPGTNPLQTSSGQHVASFSAKSVTNKVITIDKPPVIIVSYKSSCYSGFVYEIDASGSYDPEKNNLAFTWTVPANVSVSAITGSVIKYLGPSVKMAQTINFTLKVSDGKTTQTRIIPIEILPYKSELEVAEIINVEASSYHSVDYPFNVIDGNISTMWSSDGEDQWLMVELKEPFSIQYVKLAFKSGQRVESYFDILGSNDNINWETILTKSASCGFSGDIQAFDMPLSKTEDEYQYVKLVGKGNSADAWNYISELKIFGYRYRDPDYESLAVKLYPNPAQEYINIRIDEPALKVDFIRIINIAGKVMAADELNPETREFKIPINLKQGIYMVQMGLGKITLFTQKLVVKK